jgi:uncharacterized protein (DUF58 family)
MYSPRITLFRAWERLQRFLQWRLTAPGRVLAGCMLAAMAFGIDVRQSQSLQVAAMSAGLLIASLLFLFRRRNAIRIRRELPPFATIGAQLTYTLYVEQSAPKNSLAGLTVVDQLDTNLPTAKDYREFAEAGNLDSRLDRLVGFRRWLRLVRHRRGGIVEQAKIRVTTSQTSAQAQLQLLPLRRGYIQFESTRLLRPDPLGLINSIAVAASPEALLVLPRRFPVPPMRFPNSRRHQPGGLHLASQVGDSQEFLSLRDYASGDAIRHIHWRSWARTGRPIVKQYQDEFLSRQALVLDTFAAGGPLFETGISLAASFVVAPQAVDAVIDLVFMGERTVAAQAGRSLGSQRRLLELLACAQPASSGEGSDFESLARSVLQMASRMSAAVLVLLAWDSARQALVQALRAQSIAVAVVVVSNETIASDALGPMRDRPENFWIIAPDHVERDLSRVGGRSHRSEILAAGHRA